MIIVLYKETGVNTSYTVGRLGDTEVVIAEPSNYVYVTHRGFILFWPANRRVRRFTLLTENLLLATLEQLIDIQEITVSLVPQTRLTKILV